MIIRKKRSRNLIDVIGIFMCQAILLFTDVPYVDVVWDLLSVYKTLIYTLTKREEGVEENGE